MIFRDSNGKLIVIMRKDCKNELVYNQKIYDIMQNFCDKYSNSFFIPPKVTNNTNSNSNIITINKRHYYDDSDDSDDSSE